MRYPRQRRPKPSLIGKGQINLDRDVSMRPGALRLRLLLIFAYWTGLDGVRSCGEQHQGHTPA
jgi:hypothetical protein